MFDDEKNIDYDDNDGNKKKQSEWEWVKTIFYQYSYQRFESDFLHLYTRTGLFSPFTSKIGL